MAIDTRGYDTIRGPALAEGVELIGEYEGSGYKEPPSLVRRSDGQVIQLPPLLYAIVADADGTKDEAQIAADVSHAVGRGLDEEQVRYLVEDKLRPLGILTAADGTSPALEKPDPFLALRFRAAVISEDRSNRLGGIFAPLFFPLAVLVVLSAVVAVDIWLFFFHGVAQALRQSIYHPGLFPLLFAAIVLAAAFHEIGHASACRYGGGNPGKMGCGIYLAWPAFYTDVTDAYRLDRRARIRTDLGGVYFNLVVIVAVAGLYFATGFEPLLLIAVVQHFEIAHQLLPVIRLDGYYIVADVTGVPDLFARIRPILLSALPWRRPDASVTQLKRWVRIAVTGWVLVVVPLLVFELFIVLVHLPRIIGTAWDSGRALLDASTHSFAEGSLLQGVSGVLQLIVLTIPILGIVLMLARVASGIARSGWTRTTDRPVARAAFVAASAVAVGLLLYAWLPGDNYTPIKPGERGTFAEGVAAVRGLPRAARSADLRPVESKPSSVPPTTVTGTTSPTPITTTGTTVTSSSTTTSTVVPTTLARTASSTTTTTTTPAPPPSTSSPN